MRAIDADELLEFVEDRYEITWESDSYEGGIKDACSDIIEKIDNMPTIEPQPEQKYTNKELRVFMNGISMRLLSLRSAQHWKHDDETAEEIKFLERLYKKVESEVTQ